MTREQRLDRQIQRKWLRYGQRGFILIRSGEAAPISQAHLDRLRPAWTALEGE